MIAREADGAPHSALQEIGIWASIAAAFAVLVDGARICRRCARRNGVSY